MNITSPLTRIHLGIEKLYNMTSNCQNFTHYFTDQVKDITATEDTCSFIVENIAMVTLKILDKTPCSQVRFVAENDKNIPLYLTLNYTSASETETDVEASLDIDIPIFLKPIIQKPLERFVNILSEKIKISVENISL